MKINRILIWVLLVIFLVWIMNNSVTLESMKQRRRSLHKIQATKSKDSLSTKQKASGLSKSIYNPLFTSIVW